MTFDPLDMRAVVEEALRRSLGHVLRGTSQQHGWAKNPDAGDPHARVMGDIDSAGAELFVARTLGLPWTGAMGYEPGMNPADVGAHVEVRQTPVVGGCLLVHKDDPEDRIFVCVTGVFPAYYIAGWILGVHAKHERWWCRVEKACRREPCFTVPQGVLSPIEALQGHAL